MLERDHIRTLLALAALLLATMATGCASLSPAGPLRTQSTGTEATVLLVDSSESIYETASQPEISFLVSSVPVQDLINGNLTDGHFVHVELLWLPKGGATPLSSTATNISIRHVILSGGEVGVYHGAGFAIPDGELGNESYSLSIQSGTMRLALATPGFVDQLGEAEMLGSIKAKHAPGRTSAAKFALSQIVTDALGTSMFVDRGNTSDDCSAHEEFVGLVLAEIEADLNLVVARMCSERVTTP